MDSQKNLKLNNLQRDIARLEEKESRLSQELEDVRAQIMVMKKEISDMVGDSRVTMDILERVYEQRRTSDPKGKKS